MPTSCAQQSKSCGPSTDGCGVALDCGACPVGQSCGGGGSPGVCGGCVPTTCAVQGVNCGLLLDGCGNTLDCGPYKRNPMFDTFAGPHFNATCPDDLQKTFYYWQCAMGVSTGSPPPSTKGTCVPDPQPGFPGWCCALGT